MIKYTFNNNYTVYTDINANVNFNYHKDLKIDLMVNNIFIK